MNARTFSRTQDVDIKKLATGSLFLGLYSDVMYSDVIFSIYLENIEKINFIDSIFLSLLLSSESLPIKNSFSRTEKGSEHA